MQKTNTFIMFVGEQFGKAEEAVRFYVSLFPNSAVTSIEYFKAGEPGGGEGAVKQALFTLAGQEYRALESSMNHGFGFTPAVSIFVNCDSEEEIDRLYAALSDGGTAMMPLGTYGFSKKFGWTADRYGLSWQLNLQD